MNVEKKGGGCCLTAVKKLFRLGTFIDQILEQYYADAYWPQDILKTLLCGDILAWVVFITPKSKPIYKNKEEKWVITFLTKTKQNKKALHLVECI